MNQTSTEQKDKMLKAITPKNLIKNIDRIGGWSLYSLAEIAIQHYYPKEWEEKVDEWESNTPQIMSFLCNDWKGIVIKYQKEIGYKKFSKDYVNKF